MFSMTALLVLPILADVFVRGGLSGEVRISQSRVVCVAVGEYVSWRELGLWWYDGAA